MVYLSMFSRRTVNDGTAMTKDEPISLAQNFVRSNYAIAPPGAGVMHATERASKPGPRFHMESWFHFPGSSEMPFGITGRPGRLSGHRDCGLTGEVDRRFFYVVEYGCHW